jgi:hypothetical protein
MGTKSDETDFTIAKFNLMHIFSILDHHDRLH